MTVTRRRRRPKAPVTRGFRVQGPNALRLGEDIVVASEDGGRRLDGTTREMRIVA
jgi:hypothetical protein